MCGIRRFPAVNPWNMVWGPGFGTARTVAVTPLGACNGRPPEIRRLQEHMIVNTYPYAKQYSPFNCFHTMCALA